MAQFACRNAAVRTQPNTPAQEKTQKVLFFLIAIIIQAALFLKWPLYLFRQYFPRAIHHYCQDSTIQHIVNKESIFTDVMYSILYLGRFTEALIIEIQIYKFFFHDKDNMVDEILKSFSAKLQGKRWLMVLLPVITIYMAVHSLSVVSLGISLEVQQGHAVGCNSYPYEAYIIYWILDGIRYCYDVLVRVLLIVATLGIRYIWKNSSIEQGDPPQRATPKVYTDVLEDRDAVSKDHKLRTKEYVSKGKKVESISEIFQTWFILPWIIFLIGSSLSADHILRAWKNGVNSEDGYDFSEITLLIYNLNQVSLLLIPYLCSLLINQGHKKYLTELRSNQLNRFENSASTFALASMQKIEKNIHFNFVPRIWRTSIKIHVDEPFFVIFLFIGVFFTLCEAFV